MIVKLDTKVRKNGKQGQKPRRYTLCRSMLLYSSVVNKVWVLVSLGWVAQYDLNIHRQAVHKKVNDANLIILVKSLFKRDGKQVNLRAVFWLAPKVVCLRTYHYG